MQELKLVNQQDITGATALHYAAQGGFLKVSFLPRVKRSLTKSTDEVLSFISPWFYSR